MTPGFAVVTSRRPADVARASRITEVLKDSGLREIHRSARQTVLASTSQRYDAITPGVLAFGEINWRCSATRRDLANAGIGTSEQAAVLLATKAWGRYVALFDDGDELAVMADPSGAGIAYDIADDGVSLLCDRVTPALVRIAGVSGAIDLEALRGCLTDPTTAIQAKLLQGVQRLIPGRLHPLLGRRAVTVWSPAMVTERRDDPEHRLRNGLDQALSHMSGSRPLVQLSGGLDSSIVLGSLAAVAQRTHAVTATSSAGDVEETHYARSAASHVGVPLIEKPSDAFPDFRSFCQVAQIAHPYLHGLDDLFARGVAEAGSEVGADRVVTGQGGDALFFHPPSPLVAVDRRRSLGSLAASRSLVDDARRSGTTIWHHLIPAELDRFRPAHPPVHAMVPPWIVRGDPSSAKPARHPWITDAEELSPGKRLHVMMLANSQLFHSERPDPGVMPLHHPLLSQPMMETALSIPVWMLASGPLNRGLARRAFASRIPADVAVRASKGEATVLYGRAALANLPFLREFLLGGSLSCSGIVDAARLEEMLTPDLLFHSLHNHSLMLLASCEAWLKAWK